MPPFVKRRIVYDRRVRWYPIAVTKQRADAVRNRERLLAVAKLVFVEVGPNASLEQIAKRAGVGIGTLYRHFPNRAAIVEALYRHEVDGLVEAANQLAKTRPPVDALREWMRLFVDYMATKRLVRAVLDEMATDNPEMYASSSRGMKSAITLLADRAVAAGEIQLDMEPLDLLRAIAGLPEPSARRLIDVIVAGMRVRQLGG